MLTYSKREFAKSVKRGLEGKS